jgi:peptide-methionine (S)-S-oxide reductase
MSKCGFRKRGHESKTSKKVRERRPSNRLLSTAHTIRLINNKTNSFTNQGKATPAMASCSLHEILVSPFVRGKSHRKGKKAADAEDSSLSETYLPVPQHLVFDEPHISSKVALAAGKFWGTEKFVLEHFQERFPASVLSTGVGFMSPYDSVGIASQPTYEDVCSGDSGHVEVVLVELADPRAHFEELVRFFFQFHDPTTKFQQGSDRGFHFSSWIFCSDDEQLEIARRVRLELQQLVNLGVVRYEKDRVVTCVSSMHEFTPASDEHSQYLTKHPDAPCYQKLHFSDWPDFDESTLSMAPASLVSVSVASTTSSSSSASATSAVEEDDDQAKRMRALQMLRNSQKRQTLFQSIVSTMSA